jgi:hypothetical protein
MKIEMRLLIIGLLAGTVATAAHAQNYSYQQGAAAAARLNREQYLLQQKIKDYRLKELLRRYSSVFAAYGPQQSGKDYNADKFHQKIEALAREYGDRFVLDMVAEKDWGALERHLKHLETRKVE